MNIKINLICPSPASNILSSPGAVLLSKKKESVSLFPSSPLPQIHNSFYTTIIYLDRFEIKITPQAPLFANWAQYQCPCLLSVQKCSWKYLPLTSLLVFSQFLFPFPSVGLSDSSHKETLGMFSCNFLFQGPLNFPSNLPTFNPSLYAYSSFRG